jgi:hypothetical protein
MGYNCRWNSSIAVIIGVIITYFNYVHPPTTIVPIVQIAPTAPVPTQIATATQESVPTPTPLPSINTAQDIYMQFTNAGIAMGDEGNVPNSWWSCCTYVPANGALSFIDVTSGGKMIIALFSTFNGAQTDATQIYVTNPHPGYEKLGTCLLLYWSTSTNLTPYVQVMQQYCV